eukprot:TRINITY_DN14884_c0_g1_i1.p1 TRINITY_DN14884_c0_g1~~TRINITY_DN14884_c0_g1_i1.p1  ORF type:complete len:728 (+),score=45.61 TRINITY_DN14884_c0_g1_i1:29-2212(+)
MSRQRSNSGTRTVGSARYSYSPATPAKGGPQRAPRVATPTRSQESNAASSPSTPGTNKKRTPKQSDMNSFSADINDMRETVQEVQEGLNRFKLGSTPRDLAAQQRRVESLQQTTMQLHSNSAELLPSSGRSASSLSPVQSPRGGTVTGTSALLAPPPPLAPSVTQQPASSDLQTRSCVFCANHSMAPEWPLLFRSDYSHLEKRPFQQQHRSIRSNMARYYAFSEGSGIASFEALVRSLPETVVGYALGLHPVLRCGIAALEAMADLGILLHTPHSEISPLTLARHVTCGPSFRRHLRRVEPEMRVGVRAWFESLVCHRLSQEASSGSLRHTEYRQRKWLESKVDTTILDVLASYAERTAKSISTLVSYAASTDSSGVPRVTLGPHTDSTAGEIIVILDPAVLTHVDCWVGIGGSGNRPWALPSESGIAEEVHLGLPDGYAILAAEIGMRLKGSGILRGNCTFGDVLRNGSTVAARHQLTVQLPALASLRWVRHILVPSNVCLSPDATLALERCFPGGRLRADILRTFHPEDLLSDSVPEFHSWRGVAANSLAGGGFCLNFWIPVQCHELPVGVEAVLPAPDDDTDSTTIFEASFVVESYEKEFFALLLDGVGSLCTSPVTIRFSPGAIAWHPGFPEAPSYQPIVHRIERTEEHYSRSEKVAIELRWSGTPLSLLEIRVGHQIVVCASPARPPPFSVSPPGSNPRWQLALSAPAGVPIVFADVKLRTS